ncbi:MAG: hypothetical protein ACLTTH_02045 [Holdemanella porci]
MAKSLVTGAVGSVIGRNNPHTGHLEGGARGKILGDVNAQGNRVGGARGAIFGNPDSNGNRNGGIKGATLGNSMNMGGVTGRQGGIRGAIFGNDQLASEVLVVLLNVQEQVVWQTLVVRKERILSTPQVKKQAQCRKDDYRLSEVQILQRLTQKQVLRWAIQYIKEDLCLCF